MMQGFVNRSVTALSLNKRCKLLALWDGTHLSASGNRQVKTKKTRITEKLIHSGENITRRFISLLCWGGEGSKPPAFSLNGRRLFGGSIRQETGKTGQPWSGVKPFGPPPKPVLRGGDHQLGCSFQEDLQTKRKRRGASSSWAALMIPAVGLWPRRQRSPGTGPRRNPRSTHRDRNPTPAMATLGRSWVVDGLLRPGGASQEDVTPRIQSRCRALGAIEHEVQGLGARVPVLQDGLRRIVIIIIIGNTVMLIQLLWPAYLGGGGLDQRPPGQMVADEARVLGVICIYCGRILSRECKRCILKNTG